MAKTVGQVRYYGEGNASNYAAGTSTKVNSTSLQYGTALSYAYPIVKLGVQTLPGTQMYINGSANPVVVGQTGIYELDVDGLSYITTLSFSATSLSNINANETAYLIIDYISVKE